MSSEYRQKKHILSINTQNPLISAGLKVRGPHLNFVLNCMMNTLSKLSPASSGIAAATMFMPNTETELSSTQLRVAFDGDAVLFSDESEIIVKEHGLDTFFEHEKKFENKPLAQVNDGQTCRFYRYIYMYIYRLLQGNHLI